MTVEISGVMPPLVTPFTNDQEIDEEATRREIEYMIEVGVHGIVLGGSSGEGEKLAVEEVCRLAEIAVDQVGGPGAGDRWRNRKFDARSYSAGKSTEGHRYRRSSGYECSLSALA